MESVIKEEILLESPMHWGGPVLDSDDEVKRVEGCLPKEPTLWKQVVTKIFLARSHLQRSNPERARQLIVECYMVMLPADVFDHGCPLLREYRTGLKHVLDSVWGFAKSAHCLSNPSMSAVPDNTDSVGNFLRTITPYDALDNKQKSAVEAIRAQLGPEQEFVSSILKAVKLNPREGQWLAWLGKHFFTESRRMGQAPSIQVMKMLWRALSLRRNPETYGLMMSWLVDSGVLRAEGLDWFHDAFKEFPESVTYQLNLWKELRGRIMAGSTSSSPSLIRARRELERLKELLSDGDSGPATAATETKYPKKRRKKKRK